MLKRTIKNILCYTTSNIEFPIIVNSYGRSGSTVLTKSIIRNSVSYKNYTLNSLAYRVISQNAWDLNKAKIKSGVVYKSHDYPPSLYSNKDIKMLYTFANPVDVVMSLLRLFDSKGAEWMKQHYQHLRVPYTDTFEQIIHEDQLHLEKHFNTWLKETRIQIAFVRYETMWDYQDNISEFLGFNIDLPDYRPRNTKLNIDIKEKTIRKTYSSLQKKIDSLKPFFVNN